MTNKNDWFQRGKQGVRIHFMDHPLVFFLAAHLSEVVIAECQIADAPDDCVGHSLNQRVSNDQGLNLHVRPRLSNRYEEIEITFGSVSSCRASKNTSKMKKFFCRKPVQRTLWNQPMDREPYFSHSAQVAGSYLRMTNS